MRKLIIRQASEPRRDELIIDENLIIEPKEGEIRYGKYLFAGIRTGGNIEGLGVYLPDQYDWEIVEDNCGTSVLVAFQKGTLTR